MERTRGEGDGFLCDPVHAAALAMGLWKLRGCRWCGAPLETEGTWIYTMLMCPYCDNDEWDDGKNEVTVADFIGGK
jgi:hypothetical protein